MPWYKIINMVYQVEVRIVQLEVSALDLGVVEELVDYGE